MLDIPAGDGSLDLTEALGEIKYNDREFLFKFTVNPLSEMTFDEKITQVSNALNGKACDIILDRDPDWVWEGRCIVNEHLQDKMINQIVIKAIVRPYKLKRNWTEVEGTIQENEGSVTLTLENSRKTVVPWMMINSGILHFNFEGKAYEATNPAIHIFPEVQLKEGTNSITFFRTVSSGAQYIDINYREGAL